MALAKNFTRKNLQQNIISDISKLAMIEGDEYSGEYFAPMMDADRSEDNMAKYRNRHVALMKLRYALECVFLDLPLNHFD